MTDTTSGNLVLHWFGDATLQSLAGNFVFTYTISDSRGVTFTFTQNVTIMGYQKPILSSDPASSLTLYDGLSFDLTFAAVTAGGSVPEYIAEITYS